ncbi:MAG: FUSC family protein [Chloroflexota bacterium]|nr:FUSC family protein [Chloroflexota bacterium]
MSFFDFNYKAVNWTRGIWTVITVVGAVLIIFLTGEPVAIWAGAGGMAIGLVYFNAPIETRLKFGVGLTIFGALSLGAILAFGGTTISSALILAVVIFAVGIMQSLGGPFIAAGFLVGILALNAVVAAGGSMDATWAMGSYALGGLLAMVIVVIINAIRGAPPVETSIKSLQNVPSRTLSRLRPSSYWFQFALIRAIAVGLAVYLGLTFFGDRWMWMAATTFLIVTPAWPLSMMSTLQRLAGNVIGLAIIGLIGLAFGADPNALLDLGFFLLATLIAFAFIGAGTVPMVITWTVWAFAMERVINPEPFFIDVLGERFLAILAGAGLAIVTAYILTKLRQARKEPDEQES